MRQLASWALGAALLLACSGPAAAEAPASTAALAQRKELLDSYCVACHNAEDWAGGVAFDAMKPEHVHEAPETWEAVLRKLRSGLMPPPGEPSPSADQARAFLAALEDSLDQPQDAARSPGDVVVHRLNRREYANEIERILGLAIDPAIYLPRDVESDGFDNIANVLQPSPAFVDQYIRAANEISRLALGDPHAADGFELFLAPENVDRTAHVPGLPLGTRGGMAVMRMFPADGDYDISVQVGSIGGSLLRSYPTGWLEYRHTLVVTIDGKEVFRGDLGGEEDLRAVDQQQIMAVTTIQDRFRNIRTNIQAGPHALAAAFVARSHALSDDPLMSFRPGEGEHSVPVINGLEVSGPHAVTGLADTPSRRKIFVCHPATPADEASCADSILSGLARLAFRRPVTDDDMSTLRRFYDAGAASGGFEEGVRRGITAILASPKFLYRLEPPPPHAHEGGAYALSDLQLASRLSYFLWSEGPDPELLALAESGSLGAPGVLEAQVARMLADPRAHALVTGFAFQWLGVNTIANINPDPRLYPNFDEDLRAAFVTEMDLFTDSILAGDQSVLGLLTADYTFVNARLARHYGIPGVRSEQFQRVSLTDSRRWGIFGKGSFLLGTSYPDRTSPVLRGAWILENIVGVAPTAPPPGVETNLEPKPGQPPATLRARLEAHRDDKSCNQCHGVIDPLGLALENFNAIGEWRDRDRFADGQRIDTAGGMANGRPIEGPDDLRAAMTADPSQFAQTFTERLFTYALGRTLDYADMPSVRAIVRAAAKDEYRFSAIVKGIVASDAFRMRIIPTGGDAP